MVISRKYWLIIFLFALFQYRALSQERPDFATVDSVSYHLYLNREWKALDRYSYEALQNGYDYYYLRIRWGIALFERKNYRGAITQLERALRFSANDPVASEYLYYSYLYAGYYDKARRLSRSFDEGFAAYMNTKKLSPIEFISAEGGMKISDTSSRFKTAYFTELSGKHYLGRRMSLFHAASYYQQSEFRFSVRQMQYYVNASLPLRRGFTLSASAHALYYDASVFTYSYSTLSFPAQHTTGPRQPARYTELTQGHIEAKQAFMYVGSAALTKQSRWFDLWLGATVASMDTVVQLQANLGVCYYPFGNNRLALGTAAYVHTEDLSDKKSSIAWAPFASVTLSKRLSAGAGYFANNGVNITEMNGYLINNSFDYTTSRYSGWVSFALHKKLYIYGVCARENKKELERSFNYNYNIFILGIKVIP